MAALEGAAWTVYADARGLPASEQDDLERLWDLEAMDGLHASTTLDKADVVGEITTLEAEPIHAAPWSAHIFRDQLKTASINGGPCVGCSPRTLHQPVISFPEGLLEAHETPADIAITATGQSAVGQKRKAEGRPVINLQAFAGLAPPSCCVSGQSCSSSQLGGLERSPYALRGGTTSHRLSAPATPGAPLPPVSSAGPEDEGAEEDDDAFFDDSGPDMLELEAMLGEGEAGSPEEGPKRKRRRVEVDPISPRSGRHYTAAEIRRMKRRITNRESARRMRLKRNDEWYQLQAELTKERAVRAAEAKRLATQRTQLAAQQRRIAALEADNVALRAEATDAGPAAAALAGHIAQLQAELERIHGWQAVWRAAEAKSAAAAARSQHNSADAEVTAAVEPAADQGEPCFSLGLAPNDLAELGLSPHADPLEALPLDD